MLSDDGGRPQGVVGRALRAVSVGPVSHGAMYAPQAAFFAELFATGMRSSGASVGGQCASDGAVGADPAPAALGTGGASSAVPSTGA